jgi:hypothetical protein
MIFLFACFFFSLAIGLSRRESTVFVFTDASAKDENREGELVTAARHKDIKVTSLLTGYCRSGWRRRRRETHGILIFLFINHIRILGGRMASWP